MALFTFKKNAIDEAKILKAQDFTSAGIKEEALREVLVKHLDQLDDKRKMFTLALEYSNWSDASRRIDILAIDEDENLVVIELKRTHDGGHAELQALRYAAMLSTHTFANVVQALYEHRKKTDKGATFTQAEQDLLDFLEKTDASEVKLGKIPRIILVAQGFSTEITTTALWLMEHMKINIACYTVSLYPYADEFALHFDLLLPLPQQADYFVKVRDKNNEEAEQAEKAQRRQNACKVLEGKGLLQQGAALKLIQLPKAQIEITEDSQRKATYMGGGRVLWEYDGHEYSSLSNLCKKLCEMSGHPIKNSIQGTLYWGKTGENISLAQAALDCEVTD